MNLATELQAVRESIRYFESLHHMKKRSGGKVPVQEIDALTALREKEKRLLAGCAS